MALTPLDIHHKEFRTARFGGYNEEEVDSFLDQVADEFEKLAQENVDLIQQVEQIRIRLAEFEEMKSSLQAALLAATKSAEVVKEEARQESEATLAKAQEESDSLIRSAQEQSRQMILNAQNERQKLERNFARLREIKGRYLQSLRELADAHLRQVSELESKEGTEVATEVIRETGVEEKGLSEQELPLVQEPPVPRRTIQPQPEPTVSAETQAVEIEPVVSEPPARPAVQEDPRVSAPPTFEEAGQTSRAVDARSQEIKVEEVRLEESIDTGVSAKAGMGLNSPQTFVQTREPFETPVESRLPTANLVDEVLAMDEGGDIYSELGENGDEGEQERESKVRKTKKEKKDKHFFWE